MSRLGRRVPHLPVFGAHVSALFYCPKRQKQLFFTDSNFQTYFKGSVLTFGQHVQLGILHTRDFSLLLLRASAKREASFY